MIKSYVYMVKIFMLGVKYLEDIEQVKQQSAGKSLCKNTSYLYNKYMKAFPFEIDFPSAD